MQKRPITCKRTIVFDFIEFIPFLCFILNFSNNELLNLWSSGVFLQTCTSLPDIQQAEVEVKAVFMDLDTIVELASEPAKANRLGIELKT